ncbi:hypothetical protein C5O75_028920 [Burkholderia cepacia]|jgi:hypothetical protein|uniref:hypothetical protein n=1 Tax=Burkholderia cepacia TaxID=292 RepID=UPI0011B0E5B3|nr:hypothetical protein [Burkholderia cepacia]KAB1587903.1 hypothetical protein C5O75_028920 [Burkholderia cepacia]
MSNNEAAVISVFKDALREYADTYNRQFKDYPLGGQDRYALGDDFWATYDHFAIVESKWSQNQIHDEKDKFDRVKALCEALRDNPDMASLHERCHRIAWRETGKNSNKKRLMSQVYRDKVCVEHFPRTCTNIASPSKALTIDEFGKEFFDDPPSHCLPINDFINYIKWLTKVVSGKEREILVLARLRDKDGYTIADHVTLSDLSQSLPKLSTTSPTTPKNEKKFKN